MECAHHKWLVTCKEKRRLKKKKKKKKGPTEDRIENK